MIKPFHQIVLIILFAVGMIPVRLKAQQDEKWWLRSSLADTIVNLQFHASGKYSFTNMQGVISGKMHTGDITLVQRKGIFTNFTRMGIDVFKMHLTGIVDLKYETTAKYFTDYLNVDISRIFFGQSGFIWERDDALLLHNRYSFYGGVGINLLSSKKLKLNSLLALGRIDQDYMINVDNYDVIKKPYTAFYTVHEGVYTINPSVSLAGKIYYYSDIDEKDRYRYGLNLNLIVSLTKHINLMVGGNYRYDRELLRLGLLPDNSMQHVGLEVSL